MVLVDDNFATIVSAVRDGRRIFDNLTRAFAYVIAFHPPLLLGALVMPLLNRPLWLLPVHLVVLELVLHPVVSLVFQAEPADADVMQRPPRPLGDALRVRNLAGPFVVGTVFAAALIAEYLVAMHAGWPVDEARALAFVTLLVGQPFLVMGVRSPERAYWRARRAWTRTLSWVTVLIVGVAVAIVQIGPLADLLQFAAFPLWAWGIVIGVAFVATSVAEPFKGRGTASGRPSR